MAETVNKKIVEAYNVKKAVRAEFPQKLKYVIQTVIKPAFCGNSLRLIFREKMQYSAGIIRRKA